MRNLLRINPEVQEALGNNQPVVALESTIISHGFSYPENLNMALECDRIIRAEGAIPATIGIIEGEIVIGLTRDEIQMFAENRETPKCSRRDVPTIISLKQNGATTVATTMMFAQMAGIKVFATGGIGGVHFNGENTMDISADLEELANTNVAVVCSGAKSILDIPRTLEYLETKGVPVVGYQTDAFPDFYTRDSGKKVTYNFKNMDDLAQMVHIKNQLNIKSGVVIANPIPEESALEPSFIRKLIQEAVTEAATKGIEGNKVTPYILSVLHERSEGKSVVANKALVFNNSKVAAQLAVAMTK
ncbi:MAG: pseudouridine-5'-phosphate glycosidase [Erysipelothrix sp.]|nr:pseudouridine-5'-phosphate glycosidase [Erysipelothrix sp.]